MSINTMCPELCKVFVQKEFHLSVMKRAVSLLLDKELGWKWLSAHPEPHSSLAMRPGIQGPTLSPLTLWCLIIEIIYLHLREEEKKAASLTPSGFLRMLATLMSDTDLLNYSLFFVFIRFY